LKPDNILIKNRQVKICDYGISKILQKDKEIKFDYGMFPKNVMIPEVIEQLPLTITADSF